MQSINEGLSNFNELQNQLLEAMNPNSAKEQAKEVVANLLLGMGVPYFLGRLQNTLPDDIFKELSEFVKDPANIGGKAALKFASKLFTDKVLSPLKQNILSQLQKYVPELKDINLESTSLDDIKKSCDK